MCDGAQQPTPVWRNGVLIDQQGIAVENTDAVQVLGAAAASNMAARQEQRERLRSLRDDVDGAPPPAEATCSTTCCSSVGLFLLAYLITVTVGTFTVATAAPGLSTKLHLLAIAVAPPLAILVFLARTFGDSVDRRQVCLTFFTAVLWMPLLLAFIYGMLAPTGAFRAVYSLDPVCDECFESVAVLAKPCPAFGQRWDATNDPSLFCCLPDVTNTSRYHSWPIASSKDGTCSLPLSLDAEPPTSWGCSCHWRNVVMAFLRAAFLEESLKFLAVATIYTKDYVADPSSLVLYAITGACGFALVENIQYVLASASVSTTQALTTAVVRAILSIPLHAGTGAIIGSMLARRRFVGRKVPSEQLGFCHIIALPVLFHGFYDWFAFEQPLGTAGSAQAALLNNIVAPALLVLGTWLTARREYTKVDSHPQVGAIPRVNVRLLERDGILPHAKLSDCLCRNFLCDLLREPEQRMRLTTIQEASRAATTKIEHMNAPLLPVSMAMQMSSEAGDVIANSGGGSLCTCFSDLSICCVGYFCPCWLFGHNLRDSGQSKHAWTGCLAYTALVAVGTVGFIAIAMAFDLMTADCTTSTDGSGSDFADEETYSPACGFAARIWLLRVGRSMLLTVTVLAAFGALCGWHSREASLPSGYGHDGPKGSSSARRKKPPCVALAAAASSRLVMGMGRSFWRGQRRWWRR